MDRRQLLKAVGGATGSSALGVAGILGTSAAQTDVDLRTSPLEGARRRRVVDAARNSAQFGYVTDQLGTAPDLSRAIEYGIDDISGVMTQFGPLSEGGPLVRYFRSTAFPRSDRETRGSQDVRVVGVSRPGKGVRVIDGFFSTVTDVGITPEVESLENKLDSNGKFQRTKRQVQRRPAKFELHTDTPYLLRDPSTPDDKFVYLLPITRDDEFHQFLRVWGTDPRTAKVRFDPAPSGRHITCFFGICANWCTIICGVLAAAAAGGCGLACVAFIASAPIAPACGVLCGAVAAGICQPTCTKQVH